MRPRTDRVLVVVILITALPLSAQKAGRDLDFLYGRWYQGNQSTSYEVRAPVPLAGIFSHGLTAQVLIHDSLGRHRAFYGAGWQLQAWRHRSTLGPYAIAGVSLGLSTDTTAEDLAALWTVGGGLEWRPAWWVAFGLESVYRLQDVGPRGFWRSSPGSRSGVSASLGVSLVIGPSRPVGTTHSRTAPPPEPPLAIAGNAADVVRTSRTWDRPKHRWVRRHDLTAGTGAGETSMYLLARTSREQANAGAGHACPRTPAAAEILPVRRITGRGATPPLVPPERKFIHSE